MEVVALSGRRAIGVGAGRLDGDYVVVLALVDFE